jgi:hypothetical protein
MRTSPESCPAPAAGTPLLTRPVAVPEGPSSLSLQPSSTAAKPRRRRGRAALPRGPYASAGPVARLSGGDGARRPLGATSPGVGGGVGYPRFGGGLFLPGPSRHSPPKSSRGVDLRQPGRPALRHAGGTRPGDRPRLLVALRGPHRQGDHPAHVPARARRLLGAGGGADRPDGARAGVAGSATVGGGQRPSASGRVECEPPYAHAHALRGPAGGPRRSRHGHAE